MAFTAPEPPVREPLVDARGYMTPRWVSWLKELLRALEAAI